MAEGLNRVMLLGNLGADPELRFTQGGSAVLNMRLATTESYLDKDKVRRDRTDWHNIVVWGKRGEALAKFLTKGSSIFVEGSLRTSSYDDRDGNKRYKTEVHANNILITGGRGRGGAGAEDAPPEAGGYAAGGEPAQARGGEPGQARGGGGSYGARPASGGASRPRPAPAAQPEGPPAGGAAEGDDFGYGGGSDDDIPF
jgi:single-strand DNA-binding protein